MAGKNTSGPEEDLISRREAIKVVNDVIDKTAVRTKDMRKLNLVKLGLERLESKNVKKKRNLQ